MAKVRYRTKASSCINLKESNVFVRKLKCEVLCKIKTKMDFTHLLYFCLITIQYHYFEENIIFLQQLTVLMVVHIHR